MEQGFSPAATDQEECALPMQERGSSEGLGFSNPAHFQEENLTSGMALGQPLGDEL